MQFLTFLGALLATAAAAPAVSNNDVLVKRSGKPFTFPLANGFPTVNATTLESIERQAGGPLSTQSYGSTALSALSANALRIVTFNELFEVAFFSELLQNVTNNVEGFELGNARHAVMDTISSSQAQEELHAYSANAGLNASGFDIVRPCAYNFPVSNFTEAMAFADNFSSLLVGGISNLLEQFKAGGNGQDIDITLYASVIGQEGEQEGFFRLSQDKVPNANAFMTSTTLSYIYSHIAQHYIAEGSCPPGQTFNVTTYETLTPLNPGAMKNTTVSYSTTQTNVSAENNYIAYISGGIIPVVVPITDITIKSAGLTTFSAAFPYDAGFSRGMTYAALVNSAGPFANVTDVALATLAGPGLFQLE